MLGENFGILGRSRGAGYRALLAMAILLALSLISPAFLPEIVAYDGTGRPVAADYDDAGNSLTRAVELERICLVLRNAGT